MSGLEETLREIGAHLAQELASESDLFRSLKAGTIDKAIYEAFLVQQYKLELAIDAVGSRLHEALPCSPYDSLTGDLDDALEEPEGASPHELALQDLGVLWGYSERDTFARADATPQAPIVGLILGVIDTILFEYAWAAPVPGLLMDEVFESARDAPSTIKRRTPWPTAERTTAFLERAGNRAERSGGGLILPRVRSGKDTDAVITVATTTAHLLKTHFCQSSESSGGGGRSNSTKKTGGGHSVSR